MSYYDSFVAVNGEPARKWEERLQELTKKRFSNASTFWEDIEEENQFGTQQYHTISARITSLVDAHTGQRVNDDYKKIIFPDLSYEPALATRYRFNNNVWIVFSTGNIRSATSAAYLRRCNNTINMEDKYGNIQREPCYIDYKVTENQLDNGETIAVPSGRIQVYCQRNRYTEHIKINDRFIFGNYVYKVRSINDYDRTETFNNDSRELMNFYADFDNISSCDNFKLGVADYVTYNYQIGVVNTISGPVGTTGNLNAICTLDGNQIDEPLKYEVVSGEDIVSIDQSGNYEFLADGDAQITVSMKNLETCTATITVSVGDYVQAPYIIPDVSTILINQTISYEIVYNGILEITVDTENPSYYYKFVQDGNKFSITNYKQSDMPIVVKYTDVENSIGGEYTIYLGGII